MLQGWTVVFPDREHYAASPCYGLHALSRQQVERRAAQAMQCNWSDLERRGWRAFFLG